MRRGLIALTLAIALSSAASAWALEATSGVTKSPNSPTSGELVEQPKVWDGKQISFTGEVITDAMERGEYSWIHINDDAYYLKNVEEGAELGGYNSGHGVWLPTTLTRQIKFYGDYKHEGDIVTVKGTFNAACGQHGGDMDIHADSLVVDKPGHPVNEPVKPVKALVAFFLVGLAALSWEANRRAERRELRGLFGNR